MAGPLGGVRVIELAGLGPAPFGAMVLADLGAAAITTDPAASVMGADLSTAPPNREGGGLLLALGVCAALVERATSGRGQVIDAAMVDGASLLAAAMAPAYTGGYFSEDRGTNLLDSGAPFYDCFETADGQWLSLGALE